MGVQNALLLLLNMLTYTTSYFKNVLVNVETLTNIIKYYRGTVHY